MAVKNSERAITFELNETKDYLIFKSGNGDAFTLRIANLSVEAGLAAIAFGVARKVVNAAALDAGATVADKWAAVLEVAQRLDSGGAWNGVARTGGGSTGGLLFEAMSRVYGDDAAKVEATLERTMSKKGLTRAKAVAFWSGVAPVAEAILEIKIERAKKAAATSAGAGIEADEELEDLRG